ncbi:hypothetical protein LSH36_474g03045 [Paralvinella palmiformis]|uniref:Uncharacterized protein n=1 Tax=Paralvinella palmiformis TaxID=53620 RepID=A0AAD9JAY1_9ANNE|nr:hypothetical protein LSH36_474g03045 [Paralvinella palmiformis]
MHTASGKSLSAHNSYLDRFHGNSAKNGPKALLNLYEDCRTVSAGVQQPKISLYVKKQSVGDRVKDVTSSRVRSNESVTLYGKVRTLLLAKRRNISVTPAVRRPDVVVSRPRSSLSRLSKLSQRSVVRQSSDGMDNTDQSSEADHDKDPECQRSPVTTVHKVIPHRHIDTDTLDKIHRWMDTLPPKFSGLCSVISVPDTTHGFQD